MAGVAAARDDRKKVKTAANRLGRILRQLRVTDRARVGCGGR
jgi:hypothetical protein